MNSRKPDMTSPPAQLDDPLADLFDAAKTGSVRPAPELSAAYTPKTHTETCAKCGGSGKFYGYNGRSLGQCFACKGAGKKTFKTSRETRTRQRAQSSARRETKRLEKVAEQNAWRELHKAELEWLSKTANREETRMGMPPFKFWEFPVKLRDSLAQYGTLTEGQIGAIRKCMARDAERAEQRKAEKAAAAVDIDVNKIEEAFDRVRSQAKQIGAMGVRWLTLYLDTFKFLDMPAKGQWEAAIMVSEGDTKLGKIVAGKFNRFRPCTDEQVARIVAAAADPLKAAEAFGLKYSRCSCCGLELTNPESIKRGIGPICAEKWFCA